VEVTERHDFAHSAEELWAYLRQIRVIAECLPGAEITECHSDGSYSGRINFKFGPKLITFTGSATFEPDDDRRTGLLEARGSDNSGRSRANAIARFQVFSGPQPSAASVEVAVKMAFVGPLSSFADSGGVYVGRQLLADFAATLDQRLTQDSSPAVAPVGVTPSAEIRLGATIVRAISLRMKAALARLRRRWGES
jgi:carbon monoxide dehydrogenase subunit G